MVHGRVLKRSDGTAVMNEPGGRGATVSSYCAQVSGVRRAWATQEISVG